MLSEDQIQARRKANGRIVGDELAKILPVTDVPWWRQSHLLRLNLFIFFCLFYSSAIGYDTALMNGLQSLEQWQEFMNFPTGAWLGFMNAINPLGSLFVTAIGTSFIADKYGRKACMIAWAKNPAMFIVGRFIVGSGSAFGVVSALLISELAYPTHRAVATSLYNCFYYVGSLLSAWVTYGTRNVSNDWAWRIPTLLQAGLPSIILLSTLLVPESPRWYISKNRHDRARSILTKYHANGDNNSELVEWEMVEISRSIELERMAAKSTSWSNLWKTKGNRHRLFISVTLGVFSQWNGAGIVSYYMSIVLASVGVTSVKNQTLINGFMQLWNLIFAVIAANVADKLGRRFLFLSSCIVMLASYCMITALSASFAKTGVNATGVAMIPFLFVYYAGYDLAFTPLLVSYPAEIWGFMDRARGLVTVYISVFSALMFNLFVNPIALESLAWKYYLVYIAILVVLTLICYFFYPETRGHTLEEMGKVFDGDSALVPQSEKDNEIGNYGQKREGESEFVEVSVRTR
ncbi:general substrate transporter [Lipomyces orientalis]|uniref:General substrate transporter n=1 Tax=Lipomyces orientalis TaxID=1233043 RepID=A0ACC3TUG2_9ASCO